MTSPKSISIPAVIFAMLQELSEKNRKKSDQYLQDLIKREYEKDVKPIFIYLTANQVRKLEVAKTSIIEPVTCKDIIDGFIDSAYGVALRTLYHSGKLTKEEYRKSIKSLPDWVLRDP